MFYKQFSDAQDCYKELLTSLDDAKVDTNKKLKIQKETLKVLVNIFLIPFFKSLVFMDVHRGVNLSWEPLPHPPTPFSVFELTIQKKIPPSTLRMPMIGLSV